MRRGDRVTSGRLRSVEIGEALQRLLIVEQHVHLALDVCDRAYVMSHGEIVLEGSAAELKERPDLLEASYLGGELSA